MTPLKSATKVAVEEFRIDSNVAAATAFQNHNERTLTGAWVPAERELPAGTLKVELTQPLARLAFYLIEPRADDGLVDWNLLDEALKDAKVYPIVRTQELTVRLSRSSGRIQSPARRSRVRRFHGMRARNSRASRTASPARC